VTPITSNPGVPLASALLTFPVAPCLLARREDAHPATDKQRWLRR